ncbi:MAG: hypothetical protein AVDCRST_MAG93-595 [uncultured Chloroflexia bacterium]|uniref:Uncharacterized protein n=1 Tax=uncultured Chloroflexia bacterium TaxID=1672391 RepID=A0A6J4HH14_9CHLR|nr:MAG: hypothetical protein AVDCRST_MAG93-595 [uncultured Chloroflexia bacterium]
MASILTLRRGATVKNPTYQQLAAALETLTIEDDEHPDVWLSNEDGWAISAFAGGLLVLADDDGNEWELAGVSTQKTLEVWQQLQSGQINKIRQEGWQVR